MPRTHLSLALCFSIGALTVACGGDDTPGDSADPKAGTGGAQHSAGPVLGGAAAEATATNTQVAVGGSVSTPSAAGAGGNTPVAPAAGTGSTTGTTAVPAGDLGSTTVTEVTDAQAKALCEKLQTDVLAVTTVEGTCRVAAAVAATAIGSSDAATVNSTCKAAYDECLANPSSAESDTSSSCDDVKAPTLQPGEKCDATVGDYLNCINAITATVKRLFDAAPTCSALASGASTSALEAATNVNEAPAECQVVQTKCPSAIAGFGTETNPVSTTSAATK